ncbi:MAG: glycosyltransferase family 25 protein [Verrucomicrobiia bacterium]
MNIYFINLDRHPVRMERMRRCLQGLAFERVPAVDGRTLGGPECRDVSQPIGADNITRYELACVRSHRVAWSRFLAGGEPYCCVLEDDVFLSPDFPKFVSDSSWIPSRCNLVKIETYCEKIMLSRTRVAALNRALTELRSLHRGTGGYILSRRGAEMLLAETAKPGLPLDLVIFGTDFLQRHGPLLQLIPALCVQVRHIPGGIVFEEMQSSIQPKPIKRPKPLLKRIRLEVCRPFRQMHAAAGHIVFQLRAQARPMVVPYA